MTMTPLIAMYHYAAAAWIEHRNMVCAVSGTHRNERRGHRLIAVWIDG
jgi:hypothetical protein